MFSPQKLMLYDAVSNKLVIVHEVCKKWALSSANGAGVWHVGAEYLPHIAEIWRQVYVHNAKHLLVDLLHSLDTISRISDDIGVASSVDAAKLAAQRYQAEI